jgi:hypothetical protein
MARKKPSGAQRDRLALLMRAMKNGPIFARGRPRGVVTEPIKHIRFDFDWVVGIGQLHNGEPHWSDLRLARELLQPNAVRWKKLRLGPCQYRNMNENYLRRVIASIRSQRYEPKTPLRIRAEKPPRIRGANIRPTITSKK